MGAGTGPQGMVASPVPCGSPSYSVTPSTGVCQVFHFVRLHDRWKTLEHEN